MATGWSGESKRHSIAKKYGRAGSKKTALSKMSSVSNLKLSSSMVFDDSDKNIRKKINMFLQKYPPEKYKYKFDEVGNVLTAISIAASLEYITSKFDSSMGDYWISVAGLMRALKEIEEDANSQEAYYIQRKENAERERTG